MAGKIRTVLGDVSPGEITGALTHEHTLLYRGKELPEGKYIAAATPALRKRIRHDFRELVRRGCNAFVDCSLRLRFYDELCAASKETGMHVVCSSGFYVEEAIPAWVRRTSAGELARRLHRDVTQGIGKTDVRCGVLKVSGNGYEIAPTERKVFLAAAAVHRKTGVPITTHTPKGARRHVEFLEAHGVPPEKVALGHIEVDPWEDIKHVARKGAMLIFTNWGGKQWVPEDMIVAQIADLVRLGYVRQIMISVDMYLYLKNGILKQRWPGGYLQIFDRVVPKLMKAGLKAKHIDTILRKNPRRHLSF